MKKRLILFIIGALLLSLAACAAGPNQLIQTPDTDGELAGFWKGLWHGMIFVITFIVSLFNDNVSVYEVHNGGHLYDLGFVLGILMITGGSGAGAGAGSKRRNK